MLLARREDFEPTPEEGPAALYWNPTTAQGYVRFPFFQARIAQLRGRFAPIGQKVAVWGCGFGYLVDMLVAEGYDAFGYDASSYAIARGKALLPSIAGRLFVRNALVAGDMTPSRRDAGLQGNQRFPLLITEDLLSCLTDAEIAAALTNLRGISTSNLLHILTTFDSTAPAHDPRCTWKTVNEWRAVVSPPDAVYDSATNTVWNAGGQI